MNMGCDELDLLGGAVKIIWHLSYNAENSKHELFQ